MAGSPGRQALA